MKSARSSSRDEDVKKGEYAHYMLKEIFEQPGSVRDAMRGRLSQEECSAKLGGLDMTAAQLRDVGRIVLTGCGTALHAAMIGEYISSSSPGFRRKWNTRASSGIAIRP